MSSGQYTEFNGFCAYRCRIQISLTHLDSVIDCLTSTYVSKLHWLLSSITLTVVATSDHVSKNVPPLACYNSDTCEWILIFFLAEMLPIKQEIKRRFTMPPQLTCASALPGKMGKHENHIFHSVGLCCTHSAPVCCLPGRKRIGICDVFDSV